MLNVRCLFVCLSLLGLAVPTFATPRLKSPQPGEVYKDFTYLMVSQQWRVTDPGATNAGSPGNSPGDFLPNPTMTIPDVDLAQAVRAEAVIDAWGGHIGTTGKRFRLNGNGWITVPELDTTPTAGQCYLQQVSYVLDVPLADLVAGSNTFHGDSGSQSCYSFRWGQWGWYSFTIRVYYDPDSKPHPTGSITGPSNDATIQDNPLIALDAQGGTGIDVVDVFAAYDGYDEDGDGHFDGYHYNYHRAKSGDTELFPRAHVGRLTSAPWQITWDTSLVQDQLPGAIKLMARIRDTSGMWYVTDEVTGLTLDRPASSVKLYRPQNVIERAWARNGATVTSNFTIPDGVDLSNAVSARLLSRTWNGVAGHAEPGEITWNRVNGTDIAVFGENHHFQYDVVNIPVGILQNGENSIQTKSESSHHGIEILWPGPAMLVTYNTVVGSFCGDGNQDPGEQCDDGNLTDDDGCSPECEPTVVDYLKPPKSGSVYREYSIAMFGQNWRVTDPDATHPGSPGNSPGDFLPNPVMDIDDVDLTGAVSAQAVIDQWGGHPGTSEKEFSLNGNDWLRIPELATAPPPVECFLHQITTVIDVPLEHLTPGTNELQGNADRQVCQSFNWGQWGWYLFTLRVFYEPDTHPHATGAITSPVQGDVLLETDTTFPTFTADVQGDVERVEFFAYHEAYDTNGDGNYVEYHHNYHREKTLSEFSVKDHVGTATGPPWTVTWDTSRVPQQAWRGVKVIARVLDTSGNWYVTDEVVDLSLLREGSVRLYKPQDVPAGYWARAGRTKLSRFTVPTEHDLGDATGSWFHIRTWNGIDGHAEEGEEHYTRINSYETPDYGANHFYQYDVFDVPLSALRSGLNTVRVFSDSSHHGMEILWPGPAAGVRYATSNGVCGDGLLDWGEECDDGNAVEDDGCSPGCIAQFCGDGELGGSEVCDDGNTDNGDGCDEFCLAEICGNGATQIGEECDDGNDDPLDACDECVANFCGDGIPNNGEDCDDGANVDGDGCDAACFVEVCGNGIPQIGEECDDGNDDPLDACNDCIANICGDAIVNNGEECDDGNTDNDDACRNNCNIPGCGDDFVDPGEECDDGNDDNLDGCNNNCIINYCGDGFVNNGEDCDDGNLVDDDFCTNACITNIVCDNAIVNGDFESGTEPWRWFTDGVGSFSIVNGEAFLNIDTAGTNVQLYQFNIFIEGSTLYRARITASNTNNRDIRVVLQQHDSPYENYGLNQTLDLTVDMQQFVYEFTTPPGDRGDARLLFQAGQYDQDGRDYYIDDVHIEKVADCPLCGDGVVSGNEACDDGNISDDDDCGSDCQANFCGDAEVNNGEDCDDGNTTSGDGCDENCVGEVCGNGVLQGGEDCDDGNTDDLDTCSNSCVVTYCGDGITNNGEDCDDGNTDNDDACTNSCIAAGCGDGVINGTEDCDDGNTDDLDGCNNDCTLNFCGDGIVNNGERCDDGNTDDGDDCNNACIPNLVCLNAVTNPTFTDNTAGWFFFSDGSASFQSFGGEGRLAIVTQGSNVQVYQPGIAVYGGTLYRFHIRARNTAGSNVAVTLQQHTTPYTNYGLSATLDLTTTMQDFVVEFTTSPGDKTDARLMLQVGNFDLNDSEYFFDDIAIELVSQCGNCGNGVVDADEECDDGNLNDTDDCSNDCRQANCGDGVVNGADECDDGNAVDDDACSNGCVTAVCGDGVVNNGEECDDGNQVDNDGCDNTCIPSGCGDGIVVGAEQCDDGNTEDLDACNNACVSNFCGDGIVNNGEACDDGNAIDTDVCSNACYLNFSCDNVMQNGGFDDGTSGWRFFTNGVASFSADGGEGVLTITQPGTNIQAYQTAIALDGSSVYRLRLKARSTTGSDLRVAVQKDRPPYNGYGLLEILDVKSTTQEFHVEFTTTPGDKVDARLMVQVGGFGPAGAVYVLDDIHLEKMADCSECGDGVVDPGEQCDDGNDLDDDGCSNNCRLPGCGDGVVQGAEACDDGNTNNYDSCSNGCIANYCGDGVINNGEQCDDGNSIDSDLCDNSCAVNGLCDNALSNGSFGGGAASWRFFTNGTGTFDTTGSEAHLSITTEGTNVQLYQSDIAVMGSTSYRLRIRAANDQGLALRVTLQKHGAPYTNYGLNATLGLSPQMQDFIVEFTTPPGGFADARLMLQVGQHDVDGTTYTLDNIAIEAIDQCPAETGPAPMLSEPPGRSVGMPVGDESPTRTAPNRERGRMIRRN